MSIESRINLADLVYEISYSMPCPVADILASIENIKATSEYTAAIINAAIEFIQGEP